MKLVTKCSCFLTTRKGYLFERSLTGRPRCDNCPVEPQILRNGGTVLRPQPRRFSLLQLLGTGHTLNRWPRAYADYFTRGMHFTDGEANNTARAQQPGAAKPSALMLLMLAGKWSLSTTPQAGRSRCAREQPDATALHAEAQSASSATNNERSASSPDIQQ